MLFIAVGVALLTILVCVVFYINKQNENFSENFSEITHYCSITQQTTQPTALQSTPYALISDMSNLIIKSKPKILIISCYGYGNIGDNMYSEVFTHYFSSDCEIVKISDHSIFVNDRKQFSNNPPRINYKFDFLVLGGGGLITSAKLKDSKNISFYTANAMDRKVPIFIISCGIQGPLVNFENKFSEWKPIFQYASLITVRSRKDSELIAKLMNGKLLGKLFYFRDLGYIYPHLVLHKFKRSNKFITLIIAGPVDDKNETIRKYVNSSNKEVVIMNMGAIKDDGNNVRMPKMDFSGKKVTKFYGSGKATEFTISQINLTQKGMETILRVSPNLEKINPSDLSISKVIDIIYNSEIVFTGRYHGMIFSRSMGIKYNTLGMDTNKILWESPENGIENMVINSYNHIKYLREKMGLTNNDMSNIHQLKLSIASLK